jgi:hypothetical protein
MVSFLDDFDPTDLLPAGYWRDSELIRYVVGLVATWSLYSRAGKKQRDGWAPLRWEDMNQLFGRSGRWNKLRRILLDLGIVECDEDFRIGEKAKWYRLGPAWRSRGAHLATITDARTLTRIRRAERRRGPLPARLEVHDHLDRFLAALRVDEAVARRWTCQRKHSPKQRQTALTVARIQGGDERVIVDHYGRVHSPVTNLRGKVRPALRIHGHELAEIDVSNAQPLLLGYLAAKLVTGDWSLADVKLLGRRGPIPAEFVGLPMGPWIAPIPKDLLDYLAVCERGGFYHEVAATWGLPCESSTEKNKIKHLVFRGILFGRVSAGRPRWEAFRRRWPSVANMLERIKEHDHGTSARACQRIEAYLMIEGVVGRFMRHHQEAPIQTIHDSVLVTPDAVEIAKTAINIEFASIGLKPSVKQKCRQQQENV